MSSITVYLTDNLGNPLPGQSVKLRRAGLSNFGVDYLTMSDVAGKPGKYETTDDYVTDRYKVWVNGSEDRSFGGPDGLEITKQSDILLKSGGTMTGNINMNGRKITNVGTAEDGGDAVNLGRVIQDFLAKTGGTMNGPINMDGHKITSLSNATNPGDGVSLQFLEQKLVDEDYARRTVANIMTGNNTFTQNVSFSQYPPLCSIDPTNDHHLTRRAWVIQQINNSAVPYQECVNVIRLMPEGSDQTNRVYNTWAKASNAARLLASDLRRMTVEIRGAGTAGATITPNDGGIPGNNAFNSYVAYKGINHNILLQLSGTASMSVSVGTSLVSDLTFLCTDEDAEIAFNGFIFNNVFFDIRNAATVQFTNCEFRNCIIKVQEGVTTYTTSKGSGVTTNTDLPATIQGWGGINVNDM